jgi:transcriptional regulator with XRE-family HTH domain
MLLGETLREERCKKGWSVEQLSKSSGVPGQLIREIESQSPTYVPSEANTILLGEALRIPVGLLLGHRERLFERWRPPGSSTAGSEELSA